MEKVATNIYTFEKLRKDGFTYVDKTDVIDEYDKPLLGHLMKSDFRQEL